MRRFGKKGQAWNRVRTKVKKKFFDSGITRCEMCGTDNFLSFAHRLKRRFITNDEELATVALLCIPCHEKVERSPDMYELITAIIQSRSKRTQ